MFIPIADFWMNGWGAGVPTVPNERGSATVGQHLATDATVEVAVLVNASRSVGVGTRTIRNRSNGATSPNATVGGATVGNRRPGE